MEDPPLLENSVKMVVLVITEHLWVVVIESKRSDFAVTRAIPQTLAYLLSNPDAEKDTFGLISNGSEFLFLKASRYPSCEYATSPLFSLLKPRKSPGHSQIFRSD